ncbi:MAG: HAD hydrolase-like protein [Sphingorhabdus sp.]
MKKIPFDIIGFDLDGTLVDTSSDLAAAVNHVLASIGRPLLSQAEVKRHIGGGAKMMLQQGLEATGGIPRDDFKPLYRQMLQYYESNVSVHSTPFDGALEVLDELDFLDVRYAVVTNKFEGLAVKLLTDLGLAHRMGCILGADSLGKENAKPSGAPIFEMVKRCGGGKAAYVGDSTYDVMAARNAGVPSVACSFGFLLGPVEDLGADAVIDHFDELLTALRRMH